MLVFIQILPENIPLDAEWLDSIRALTVLPEMALDVWFGQRLGHIPK